MASGDFYVDPAGRYINVYPISTRLLPVGFFFMFSFGPDAHWPPEDDPNGFTGTDDPGKQVFIGYVDDRDDISGTVEPSPGMFYQDRFSTSVVGIETRTGMVTGNSYGVMQALWFWDLSGLPVALGDVVRAEVVAEFSADPNLLSGTRDLLLTWKHDLHPFAGFEVGPDDFQSQRDGDAARIDMQTLIAANRGDIPNPWQETVSFEDPTFVDHWGTADGWANIMFAFPIGSLEQLRSGRVGLAYSLDQPTTPPFGINESLSFWGFYGDYEDLTGEGYPLNIAGFRLPFLRLWLRPREAELPVVEVAGQIPYGYGIGGTLRTEAGPVTVRRAKQVRGY